MRWLEATTSVEIARPPEAVWAFVSDLRQMPHWVRGVSDPEPTSGGAWGVGSTFRSQYRSAGRTHRVEYEVTEFAAPERYGVRTTAGPFPFEGRLSLAGTSRGTAVLKSTRAGSDGRVTSWMFAALGWGLRWAMRRRLRGELGDLKARVEAVG